METLSGDEFQSTLPVRGATLRSGAPSGDGAISIHAPLAESDVKVVDGVAVRFISIHAPLAESDGFILAADRLLTEFQSTLPVRGATSPHQHRSALFTISIHAPREGSDPFAPEMLNDRDDFNPRSP